MGRYRGSTVAFAAAYVVLVLGLFFALGGLAYASGPATSAGDQYDTKVAAVQVSAANKSTAASTTATAGASQALPNTGLSLLGAAVVGGALVATGLVLRRRERGKR